MYLIILVIFALASIFGNDSIGINKTVGWAYDISNQIFYNVILLGFSQCLFFIGYLIIAILNRYTGFRVSVIHFGLILMSIGLLNLECFIFSTIVCMLSIIIFFKNIFSTYKKEVGEIVK